MRLSLALALLLAACAIPPTGDTGNTTGGGPVDLAMPPPQPTCTYVKFGVDSCGTEDDLWATAIDYCAAQGDFFSFSHYGDTCTPCFKLNACHYGIYGYCCHW